MIGAIIGDIVGLRFEWDNIKTKKFKLFTPDCFATDDSIMTLAVAASSFEEAKTLSKIVTEPSHSHPEGLKGAEVTTAAIYLARKGKSINCIRINIIDNVVTLIKEILADGELLGKDVPSGLRSCSMLQLGHKIAIEEIKEGDRVIKYGETIGYASRMIKPGEHVHVHNMVGGRGRGDLE